MPSKVEGKRGFLKMMPIPPREVPRQGIAVICEEGGYSKMPKILGAQRHRSFRCWRVEIEGGVWQVQERKVDKRWVATLQQSMVSIPVENPSRKDAATIEKVAAIIKREARLSAPPKITSLEVRPTAGPRLYRATTLRVGVWRVTNGSRNDWKGEEVGEFEYREKLDYYQRRLAL